MTEKNKPRKAGKLTAQSNAGRWVQTDRAVHEAWARLCVKKPKAGALVHLLTAHMERGDNTVVMSQNLMAKLMGCSVDTVKRAINDLVEQKWIEVIKLGPGTVSAYRVNSRVGWSGSRDSLQYSKFNAMIIADLDDQPELIDTTDLRKIPSLYPDEIQLPSGPGEEPPSQPALDGMEPDLPVLYENSDTAEVLPQITHGSNEK